MRIFAALMNVGGVGITSASPILGPQIGGNSVVISGYGFTSATEVRFGNVLATSYVVDSDVQITAVVPSSVFATGIHGDVSATFGPRIEDPDSLFTPDMVGGYNITISGGTGYTPDGGLINVNGTFPISGFINADILEIDDTDHPVFGDDNDGNLTWTVNATTVDITVVSPLGTATIGGAYTYSSEWLPSSLGLPVRLDIDSRFVDAIIAPPYIDDALDQSGNGFDAVPTATQPSLQAVSADYASLPVMNFAGAAELHTPAGSADVGTGAVTIILVGHTTSGSTGYAVNRDTELALGNDGSNKRRIVAAGAGTSSTFDGATPGITILTCEGTSSRMYFNSNTPQALAASAHSVTAGNGWTIGNYQGGFFLPWIGPIARVIILDGAVSQPQAEAANAGLGALYGISIAP